jgi:hypothetical protein
LIAPINAQSGIGPAGNPVQISLGRIISGVLQGNPVIRLCCLTFTFDFSLGLMRLLGQ